MLKQALLLLGIGLITLNNHQLAVLAETPKESITLQSGKVKAEIASVKVVNSNNTEGWANFDGLAEVTLRLIISRDGKQKLIDTHSLMYRYGDLPHEFKLIDLDGDKEPEILVTSQSQLGSGAHSNTFSFIYKYQPKKSNYQKTEISWENFGYDIKDLDKNGIPEFVSADHRFKESLGLCTYCVYSPIQIWQFRQGKMIDVTRKYPKAIRSHAYTIWQASEKARSPNYNEQHLKGSLAGYLANKYLLNESEDGWRRVKQAYQGSDRTTFFNDLMSLLRSNGYIRNSANANHKK